MKARIITAAMVAFVLSLAPCAFASSDPAGCTQNVQFDSSIPTFAQVAATASPPFSTNNGQATGTLGGFQTGTNNRHPSADLYTYQQAIADATAGNSRVRVITKPIGTTYGGRPFNISIAGTPAHIASLEADATFWRGVRDGSVTKAQALARLDSGSAPPAFGWMTEGPNGNEPAGGEASMRMLYELAARTDCASVRRLDNMTVFFDPARNPDGRDNNTRTNAWSFDGNRDLAFQTQDVNAQPLDEINKYPGLFFIDAHHATSGLFFPPNEDPVLHEISNFALDTIQNVIGGALQSRFNDQGLQYRNYNQHDLFATQTGDAGPTLFMGGAGMTFEKGTSEVYGKQVHDLYLAMDETLNVVSRNEATLARGWVAQWQDAADQGTACKLQANQLISPLHAPPSGDITQQPSSDVCGYYLKAGQNSGDVARVIDLLRGRDVRLYTLAVPVTVTGAHDFGTTGGTTSQTLPAGTIYIPAGQTMKHWLHATMEEDPSVPFPYLSDVANWSFPELFDLGGGGQLQSPLPASAALTALTGPAALGGIANGGAPVLAFATDSSKALGLVMQLLDGGATVYRSATAFDAGGKHFPTGTAFVDASTLGALDLQALSTAAQTPVTGLASYPVPRYQLTVGKIALYTGGTTEPQNPVFPGANVPPSNGVQCTSTAYCEMVFALARELNVPVSRLDPVTSTELAAGQVSQANGYVAIINPGSTIAGGAGATALQTFINSGGNYVGYNNNGATSLRNAGVTTLNTSATSVQPFLGHCSYQTDPTAQGSLTTQGTAFNAGFDVTNPLAWGFDSGGYIYRETSGDAVFDPSTLGTATAAVSYPANLKAYGYSCNATGPGQLPGRPYAVDQPFGLGHAAVIGSNVFFRGWTNGAQRLVMNAVLYPTGGPISRGAAPLTKAQLKMHPVGSRPVRSSHDPLTDATVLVKATQAATLRRVVSRSKLPASVARRVSYASTGPYVRLTIRGAARYAHMDVLWTHGDPGRRPMWAWRIIRGLTREQVRVVAHDL